MKRRLQVFLFGVCLLAGCASFEKRDQGFRVAPVDALRYSNMSLAEIGAENDQIMQQGKDDGLEFFAPETFQRSIYYWDKVRKNIQLGQNRGEVIRDSELAKKYVDEAYSLKNILSGELQDMLEVSEFLKKLNAHQTYQKEFNGFQKRIVEMIRLYEKEPNPSAFSDRSSLLSDMERLEAQVTVEIILGPAKKIFDDMEALGLTKEAPLSLKKGNEVYVACEASIWENCRDQENLTRVGAESLFWANRARVVAEETRKLKSIKKDQFESVVLEEENRLHEIATALEAGDFRNLTLQEQAASIIQAINSAR
jgi:hypothetical protein